MLMVGFLSCFLCGLVLETFFNVSIFVSVHFDDGGASLHQSSFVQSNPIQSKGLRSGPHLLQHDGGKECSRNRSRRLSRPVQQCEAPQISSPVSDDHPELLRQRERELGQPPHAHVSIGQVCPAQSIPGSSG